MSKGWECPKCGSVYAPYVYQCGQCKSSRYDYNLNLGGYNTKDWIVHTYPQTTSDHNTLLKPHKISSTSKGFAGEA